MAVRKKRALTLREQLEAALVPESEWPYELPDNWCWTRLGEATEIIMGQSPVGTSVSDDQTQTPLIGGASDMTVDSLVATRYTSQPTKLSKEGDIVVCIRATLGNPVIANDTYCLGRGVGAIRTTIMNRSFICRFIDSATDYLFAHATGSTFQQVSGKVLGDMPLPLPPLPEQERIATRIEWLFAKLDDAEAELREVINSSEQRQAAILHKAFEGELTASWRNENHLSRDSWKRAIIKDVCRDVKVGIVIKPSQYYTDENDGTRAFRSANVREFRIEDSDWVYINDEGMSSNQRSVVHTGDVLIVRSGNPGTACVVDETFDGCNAIDILIAVPDKAIVTPDYLCAFTNSPAGKALVAQNKRGMALMHFNVKSYSALEIPLPTIEEQQVIVSKLFRMLDSERSVKGCAEVVLANIEMIRSSILAKALRGELGTNDPDEPSSKELLASVFAREA